MAKHWLENPVEPGKKPWRQRLLGYLGKSMLLFFGLGFGLVLAELAVRWLAPQAVWQWQPGPFIEDGEGYFRLRPGSTSVSKNRVEFEHGVRVNSAGLRGPELPAEQPGECRMLAIGDSFTFGVGVEGREVFHQRVAEQLRQQGQNVVAFNGGIPAIGVPRAVRWLKRHGLSTEPDLVLLGVFVGNDLHDASSKNEWTIVNGQLATADQPDGWKQWLYQHSHLYVLLKQSVPAGLQLSLRRRLGLGKPWSLRSAKEGFAIYSRQPSPLVGEGVEKTDQALAELRRLALAQGFGLAAVLIPDLVQVDDRRWQRALEQLQLKPQNYHRKQPNRILDRLFAEHGIPLLDLTEAFEKAFDAGEELYFSVDRHWTAAGHQLAAEEIVAQLLSDQPVCQPLQHAPDSEPPESAG